MSFIRNIWYVAAWSHELAAVPISRDIIGEPVALYRKTDGSVVAIEDRCPHRHAPLSLGRVEGDDLRCMYHGLKFGSDGRCRQIPGTDVMPPHTTARVFPAIEHGSWIWVWMGDPLLVDESLLPELFGLDNPEWVMRADALDYAADYQLIHDNLTDLSHLDFVHETTLGASTGTRWSNDSPKMTKLHNGLCFERWFQDHPLAPDRPDRVDTWNSYSFLLPGIFIMQTMAFPVGTARRFDLRAPTIPALFHRVEQQAVTPQGAGRSRYLYASGVEARIATPKFLDALFAVVNAAFAEDKRMIEAQQRIWNLTMPERPRAFIPQDKAPSLFRRMIAKRILLEQTVVESKAV